jgi:sugar phosphate isomerase/epimerase
VRHQYSLAHLTVLSVPPPELVEIASRTGYEYASVRITRVGESEPYYDLARDRTMMRETRSRLAGTGIRVHDVELFRMDPKTEPEALAPELEAAAELGANRIIAQLPDPDRGRAADRFGRLCDLAAPFGIFVGLEFPHWTETGTLSEATRILRVAGRANAGILIDLLHMGRSGSSVDELRSLPREWFKFAHVCDAEKEVPPTIERMLRTARCERLFPGEGSIDVRGILSCLPADIPYSLEIPRVALMKAVGPEEVARLALRVARSHLDELEPAAEGRERIVEPAHRGDPREKAR